MSSPAFNANQIQQPQLQNPLSDIATIMKIRQAQQLTRHS